MAASRAAQARIVASPAPRLAPLGGLNTRDSKRGMPASDALALVNCVVRDNGINQRKGYTVRSSGLGGPVLTMVKAGAYRYASTTTTIWDISKTTPVATVTGLGNGYWSWDVMTNGAGTVLIGCNGVNGVRYAINGVWGTATLAGVAGNQLSEVCFHGRRAFFAETNALRLWYLPVNAVQGEAKFIDLAPLCRKGGSVIAVASYSPTGGRSGQQQLVAATSKGEIIVYSGYDPDNAATWAWAGTFDAPEPVGRNCFQVVGTTLAYLSVFGLLQVPKLLQQSEVSEARSSWTDKIVGTFDAAMAVSEAEPRPNHAFDSTEFRFDSTALTFDEDADAAQSARERWQVIESASEDLLVINVPTGDASHQYVMDGMIGAWSKWVDLDAQCWLDTGRELWFGTSDGKICVYSGTTDNAMAIDSVIVESYRRTGRVAHQGRVQLLFDDPPTYRPRVRYLFDFEDVPALEATTQVYQAKVAQTVAGRGRDFALAVAIKSERGFVYVGADGTMEGSFNP